MNTRTLVSNRKDTRTKVDMVRSRTMSDPAFAKMAATAIKLDTSLLQSLHIEVIENLCGHSESLSIMDEVFSNPATCKKYKHAATCYFKKVADRLFH